MAVDKHPMRALKGTQQGRELMAQVRSHKRSTKPEPKTPPKAPAEPEKTTGKADYNDVTDSYREIADRHLTDVFKGD